MLGDNGLEVCTHFPPRQLQGETCGSLRFGEWEEEGAAEQGEAGGQEWGTRVVWDWAVGPLSSLRTASPNIRLPTRDGPHATGVPRPPFLTRTPSSWIKPAPAADLPPQPREQPLPHRQHCCLFRLSPPRTLSSSGMGTESNSLLLARHLAQRQTRIWSNLSLTGVIWRAC